MIFQTPVAGVPLDLLLSQPRRTTLAHGPRARAGIRGAADALAALHQGEMSTSRVRPVAAELQRMQRRSERIMQVDPNIGAVLNELARSLPVWLDRLPTWGAEICLVHGDCKPSQFFVLPTTQGGSGVGQVAVLDFDHCGMADPAADVGNFLASLRQAGVAHALRVRFLTAYLAARRCPSVLRLRATWYQAVALLRKALRSFARSPRSPLPAHLVQEAWNCLATLPGSD
jgi:aminoglycoside phosphotransferase (APT) family kinase protein